LVRWNNQPRYCRTILVVRVRWRNFALHMQNCILCWRDSITRMLQNRNTNQPLKRLCYRHLDNSYSELNANNKY
jgi:hypothetical protein